MINFPDSPTIGTEHTEASRTWIWNGYAWVNKSTNQKFHVGTAPPSSPENGDAWFNSEDGSLNVYYTDDDSSQWIGVSGPGNISDYNDLINKPGNVTTSDAGFMLPTDKNKLDGIASGATANSTDSYLLNRTNHTGTQEISTVTGLQEALDGAMPKSGGTFEGNVSSKYNTGAVTDAAGGTFQVMSDASNAAFMTFHRSTAYAINMGIDTDNVFRIGGWSQGIGVSRMEINSAGNMTVKAVNNSPAHRQPATNLTGTTIDMAASTDYYRTVSANTTFTLSDVGAAAGLAQAVTLIVNHTGGTITFAGATIKWAGGTAPTLTTGRVHQFFFWPDPITNQVLASSVSYY